MGRGGKSEEHKPLNFNTMNGSLKTAEGQKEEQKTFPDGKRITSSALYCARKFVSDMGR
jgi:hypothetical protein